MQPPPGQLQCPNCLIYVGINTSLEKGKKNYCRWCLMKTAQANKNDKKTHRLDWLHQFNCWQTFPLFWSVHVLHLRWAGFRRVTGHSVLRPALSCCFKLQEVTPLALLLCCLFFFGLQALMRLHEEEGTSSSLLMFLFWFCLLSSFFFTNLWVRFCPAATPHVTSLAASAAFR